MEVTRRVGLAVLAAGVLGASIAVADASARQREPWESSPDAALYIVDHHGNAASHIELLLPYARVMGWILDHCKTNAGHVADRAIDDADQASVLAGKHITTLQVLNAYAANVPKVRSDCTKRFADAEARLE